MRKIYLLSNNTFTLRKELVTTHIKIKDMLLKNEVTSDDIIVTSAGREFIYKSLFKNVLNIEEFESLNVKTQIVDLTTVNYTYSQDKNNDQIKYYKSFKKSGIEIPSSKYICLSIRNSTKRPSYNSNPEFIKKIISTFRSSYKIFLTGRGAQQYIDHGVTVVNLQEWCTLINHTNCYSVITTLCGACQAARFFSNSSKFIEIDLENKIYVNEKLNFEHYGPYPSIINSEIIRRDSNINIEHITKSLSYVQNYQNTKNLVISIVHSSLRTGLGDNLVYTTIASLAKKNGYEKVYLSFNNNPRSQTISDLVWNLNPHIDGKITEKSYPENTLESIMGTPQYISGSNNLIEMIADSYKLKHDGNLSPEIFYKPKKIEMVFKKTLWDPNFVSSNHGMNLQTVLEWLRFNKIKIDYQFKALSPTAIVLPDDVCNNIIECKDLFEYADYLNSCKVCIMLLSGGSILSSALNKRSIILYSKSPDHGNKKWMFKPNEYIYIP